jgi:glycine dehydrogenase subunit 1
MSFTPHTDDDIRQMLEAIGVERIDDLFDEIPADLRAPGLHGIPNALKEMEVTQLMQERAKQDEGPVCFAGAGAYDHHIPAAVWQIATRGEFYSAYTPYQAEASQGTLQLVYEYQSMIAALTGLDTSNASLYDGASGLAEAVLMAVRGNRRSSSNRVLMPRSVPPSYRKTVSTLVEPQGVELVDVPFEAATGRIDWTALEAAAQGGMAGLVIPQPNYFGVIDEVHALTDWAHQQGGFAIALTNPIALAVLAAPGDWGTDGADIACGDGQPLGAPIASGGPYFGFMACRKDLVRQLPGRMVGRTVDRDGNPGYVLTLQAREQHIRRSKATSNICTNQGLVVTAATIHMALLGPSGLEQVAQASMANTQRLVTALTELSGVTAAFDAPMFHEALLRFERPTAPLVESLTEAGLLAGVSTSRDYPELGDGLLVCATEKRTEAEIAQYQRALAAALA